MPSNPEDAIICTVVTRNYLHYAVALVRSVRSYHAALPVVVCVADRMDRRLDLRDPHVKVIFGDELNVPGWARFSFQYSPFELACALKPFLIRHSLSRAGVSRVIYLDADIQLYTTLHAWLEATRDTSILLTPHLLTPIPDDGKIPSHVMFTRAGSYNGGFVAVNQSSAARAFIDWWQSVLRKDCTVDLAAGHFVDQKPLDLVPGLFDGVRVYRRRGFHAAYWNLHGEQLFSDGDGYRLLSGDPLVLFHFSGMDPNHPGTLSKYQNRIDLCEFPVLRELIDQYVARLDQCGRSQYESLSYGYATLSDGTVIPDSWRDVIRTDHPALRDVEDPFDTARYPDLPRRFQSTQPTVVAASTPRTQPPLATRLKMGWRRFVGRERWAA